MFRYKHSKHRYNLNLFAKTASLCIVILFFGCSELLTEAPASGETLDGTLPGLLPELNAAFVRGDEAFEKVFTVSQGLGPIFNQPSCETCHPGDGRGIPETNLIRFSRGSDAAEDIGGGQLQDKSIPGVFPEILPPNVDISSRMAPPVFGMGLIECLQSKRE